ncbi:MAG: toll/interleukin-1 receptor domain-containing protein, partial [Oscillospiraceae bacterium]|nr:toll/interleukin-1 receptor domain-containing protein [Oscillospiraceae bacterium]
MSDLIHICPKCGSQEVFLKGERCLCSDCGARFTAAHQPPFRAMKLFLSYGHPEQEICVRIAKALRRRGHQVWFDADRILQGSYWRERIASGVASSNGVVACLSRHSVRDPGVCLDELSIAVGVRGGNIHTVLLEPERQVQPPASVCHIQWLDLSDWRERLAEGEEHFGPWFDARMEQLCGVLESDESYRFAGQMEALRSKLAVYHDTSKQKHLLGQRFVGRRWLTEQVEAWLDDPAGPRLCVLYGDPGVGKSAFSAHYLHYNPRAAAGLFCEYSRPHFNTPHTVIQTLAYLLACRLPAYRVILAERLEREKDLSVLTPSELFDLLLADPLASTVDGGHETLCILIDGLDECGRAEHNALAEVLAQYVPRLPAWLRVLVTSRRVASVTAALGQQACFALNGDGEENRADLRAYFEEVLAPRFGAQPGWPSALDALCERSGGIFLYAQLVCEGLLAGRLTLDDPATLPSGLAQVFHRWFGWFFPEETEYRARFRPALGLLLAAPVPLPAATLRRVMGWDEDELGDFTRRVGVLLRTGQGELGGETLAFTHQYLYDWLDSTDAGRFACRRAAGQTRLAEGLCRLYEQDAGHLSLYEAVCLPRLLTACGMEERRQTIAVQGALTRQILDLAEQHRPAPEQAIDCLTTALELARYAAHRQAEYLPAGGPRPVKSGDLAVCCARLAEQYHRLGRSAQAADFCRACADALPPLTDRRLQTAMVTAGRIQAEICLQDRDPAAAVPLLEQVLITETQFLHTGDPVAYGLAQVRCFQ